MTLIPAWCLSVSPSFLSFPSLLKTDILLSKIIQNCFFFQALFIAQVADCWKTENAGKQVENKAFCAIYGFTFHLSGSFW